MKLYSYFLVHPLDWEFCFMEVDDYKKWLKKSYQKKEEYYKHLVGELPEVLLQLDEMIAQAMKEWEVAFEDLEQDLRCPPLVFPIPAGILSGKATFGIVLKRSEDGDTFVYSPVPLSYLE